MQIRQITFDTKNLMGINCCLLDENTLSGLVSTIKHLCKKNYEGEK